MNGLVNHEFQIFQHIKMYTSSKLAIYRTKKNVGVNIR